MCKKFQDTFEKNFTVLSEKMDLSRMGKLRSELKDSSDIDEKWNKSSLKKSADQILNFATSLIKTERKTHLLVANLIMDAVYAEELT